VKKLTGGVEALEGAPMTQTEFHARAWNTANAEAREFYKKPELPQKGDIAAAPTLPIAIRCSR
jgi:hypothetical protein